MTYKFLNAQGHTCCESNHINFLCPRCRPRGEELRAAMSRVPPAPSLIKPPSPRASRIPIGDPDLSVCRYRIDRYNVERSAAVAAIDETLLDVLSDVPRHRAARLYTETAGSMIDRLSTLAIRIHRMRLYSERHARDGMPMPHYLSGLAALVAQRVNLACCFDEFIAGASLGIAYFSMSRRRRDREGEPQRHPAKQRDFVS